ncbi:MAG: hypothetical protein CL908_20095 [Deltaproteobacteria bacterium]|nr:hypothetical protein [Deltaproteobacteria bacterium]
MRSTRLAAIFLILIAGWLGAAYHRAHRAFDAPSWSAEHDTFIHASEAAIHYRYARMVASGQGIPALDRQLQPPGGVRPRQDFTLLMEWSIGMAHRWMRAIVRPAPPFQVTVAVVIALVSALAVPLLAGTTYLLHGSWRCGVAAALLYAVSVPAWVRASGAFIREAYTVPLLALVLLLVLVDHRRRRAWSFGLLITAAVVCFSSWHLASFVVALLVWPLLFVVVWWEDPRPVQRPLLALGLALPLASLLVEALRSHGLPLSPPGLLLMGGAVAAWYAPRCSLRRRRRALAAGGALCLTLMLVLAWRGPQGDYGHVYQALLSRFRPAPLPELPFSARAFSSGPFGTMSLGYAIERLMVLALGAGAGWIAVARCRPRPGWGARGAASGWVLASAATLLVVSLLMVRFSPLLAYLAAPLSVGWLRPEVAWKRRAPALVIWSVALGLALQTARDWDGRRGLLGALTAPASPPSAVTITEGTRRATYQWLRFHTDENAVILADFAQSPTILLASDRSIALHPMFERKAARERARLYCEGLVSTDLEAFAQLCRTWSIDYLLVDINDLLDRSSSGLRHLGGSYMLRSTSVIARLLYDSEAVEWVDLVYENAFTRIYALSTGEHPFSATPPFSPCPGRITFDAGWDRRLLNGMFIGEDTLNRLRAELRRGTSMARSAAQHARAGSWTEVKRVLSGALELFPCDPALLELQNAMLREQGLIESNHGTP